MELRNLRTFQVVAEHLNLSKAAEILRYTQPTITLQIQALEREIGYPLIQRIRKKTFLTPAGTILKEHVDELFEVIRNMETALQTMQGPSGQLRIAAPEFYCVHHLTPVIRDYFRLYPLVKLELISCHSKDAILHVLNNRADFAVIAGESSKTEIQEHTIDEEEVLLVASKDLITEPSDISKLKQFPFFMHHDQCNFVDVIKSSLAEYNLSPEWIIESGSEEAIKKAVLQASGWALLSSKSIESERNNKSILKIKIADRKIKTNAIFLQNRANEPNIMSFHQLLKENWPA
ncbi:LysR family transcriptional regulator [Shimazuella kribbensis]|uniref:LysR family transcriptional regulator n=1 Tax=Shimazuella kribbensis TaxID=139808 RepID=UPI0003FCCC6A|nr:LysR family transcriptional regulator [Shimazuella kribbensis]